MKVILISTPIMDFAGGRTGGKLFPIAMDAYRTCPPYGIYLLAAVLKPKYDVVIADLIADGNVFIDKYSSDFEEAKLIGISATSMSWPTALDVIMQLYEKYPYVPIVLGGIHPTMFDKYIISNFPVDYVIRGESEIALPRLCDAIIGKISLATVPNLTWRTYNGTIIRNPLVTKIKCDKIGEFPLPDYGDLPKNIYQNLAIEASRGCSGDCSFCSTLYRNSWRPLESEKFVERLEEVVKYENRVISDTIHIIDEDFTKDTERAIKIGKLMQKRGMKAKLAYNARIKNLQEKSVIEGLIPFTGQFLVGAELGYDEGLVKINKGIDCKKIENTAKLLKESKFSTKADFSFMIGFPGETKDEVMKTILFATELHATYGVCILIQWYSPLPGSHLWSERRKLGLVHEGMYNHYGFFRNLYLFRSTANKLSLDDIYEISDLMHQLQTVSQLGSPGSTGIQYTVPEAISENYPLTKKGEDFDPALSSLQEIVAAE